MYKNLVPAGALALAAVCFSLPVFSQPKPTGEPVKAGFVYVSPITDAGWTKQHDEGRKAVEAALGSRVKTTFVENVPEGADAERVIRDLARQGHQIIFTPSFGYMEPTLKVAKEFPDVKFESITGYKAADNVAAANARYYEGRYLAGIAAGRMTQTGVAGYVAGFPIPEVLQGINAFTLGVRSVNPDATVAVKWTHTWVDAPKAKEAAKALLDEGCDVIAQHQDAPGPQVAAEESGVWSIGYNMDMTSVAPKAHMTAPVWNWGPYYVDQIKAVMDDSWKAENYWGGMEDGIVNLSPLTENAPEGAQEAVDKAQAAILSGENKIFTGPLKDNTGQLKVPEGVTLTDEQLTSIDWLVEGVIGKVEL